MSKDPARSVAPHVRAAIAAGQARQEVGAQPKKETPGTERALAAHVQAAIKGTREAGGQMKMENPTAARRTAPHVQAAIKATPGTEVQTKVDGTAQASLWAADALQLASHGQLPGRLSRLPRGSARDAASRVLHSWKKSKGMRGASVSGSQLAAMEFDIVTSLVSKYGRELYQAGYSKDYLRRARRALLPKEEQEWFRLPEVKPAPVVRVKPPVPVVSSAELPSVIRQRHHEGASIRSLAKTYKLTRRQVRQYLDG